MTSDIAPLFNLILVLFDNKNFIYSTPLDYEMEIKCALNFCRVKVFLLNALASFKKMQTRLN